MSEFTPFGIAPEVQSYDFTYESALKNVSSTERVALLSCNEGFDIWRVKVLAAAQAAWKQLVQSIQKSPNSPRAWLREKTGESLYRLIEGLADNAKAAALYQYYCHDHILAKMRKDAYARKRTEAIARQHGPVQQTSSLRGTPSFKQPSWLDYKSPPKPSGGGS